jgi:methyl-accepting chemotaxis protein
MDGSLETIEAVRSAREAAHRTRRWRLGEWLGRINTRAAMISLLFLAVVWLLAGNALQTIARQSVISEELGVQARVVDDAATALAASLAAYGTTLGAVLAGSIPPNAVQARIVPPAAQVSAAFLALEQAVPDVDQAVLIRAREALARMPSLADRLQQTQGGRRRVEPAPLHDEWVDVQAGLLGLVDATRAATSARAVVDVAAARRIAQQARVVTYTGIALGVAATILVWLIVVVMITRPMTALHRSMVSIARGDVLAPVPLTDREDQLGLMARALAVFRDNLNVMRSRADRALEGARLTDAAAHEASRETAALAGILAVQFERLRAFASALGNATREIRELGDEALAARDCAGDAKLLVSDGLRQLQLLAHGLQLAVEDPERMTRLTSAIVAMATEADRIAVQAAALDPSGADGLGGAAGLATRARALATHSQSLALEIAATLDTLGARLRDGGAAAQQVVASIERLQMPVSETARMTIAAAAALAQSADAHGVLGEGVEALAKDGAEQAAAAGRLAAAALELMQLSGDMRAAVESAAAGARLGRNA